MRKKGFLFLFRALLFLSPFLCLSCKGGRLPVSAQDVEPHIVYDCRGAGESEQYLFVFVYTDGGDDLVAAGLSYDGAPLCWQTLSLEKASDSLFFCVFSPAPADRMAEGGYQLTLTDCYGGSVELPFFLRYDGGMAESLAFRPEGGPPDSYIRRYAYFGRGGSLEIFGEIDKDGDTLKANKHIGGKRLCCVSPDGSTICLFPYEEIH